MKPFVIAGGVFALTVGAGVVVKLQLTGAASVTPSAAAVVVARLAV